MRGTALVGAYLLARNQTPPTQDVLIDVEVAHTGDPATVHSYVFDLESGWSRGAEWTSGTSDAHTYGSPATSDKTLAIAAYYADFPQRDLRWGDLTEYNSRGPRIDGLETIDFVAPEDHLTARASPFSGQWGDFEIGGGTSNAAPLAVGVAALLKGQEPSLTADGLTMQRGRHFSKIQPPYF